MMSGFSGWRWKTRREIKEKLGANRRRSEEHKERRGRTVSFSHIVKSREGTKKKEVVGK